MPRFRFELEPLLRARKLAEQDHQRTVAAIERERLEIEQRLRNQQERIGLARMSMREVLVGRIDAHGLRMHASASLYQMRIAQRLVLELAGVHRRLDSARAGLIEATRRRRAVELLRERRLQQWRRRIDKAETAALDELAVIAAARKRSNGIGFASA